MNKEKFIIYNDNYLNLCKVVFRVLNCNAMWVMNLSNHSLSMLATESSVLEHYWDKKYYLGDPNLNFKTNKKNEDKSPWKIDLGTDCETFNKNGFLYDLYKMFHIEEFVSIEKRKGSELYCFRFFTKNNRFVFMSKLLNDLPLIKHFINAITKNINADLKRQPGINIKELKKNSTKTVRKALC